MSNLIVVGFEGKHHAAEVLEQLLRLQKPETFELDDAVAVYTTDNGRVRIDRSMNPTSKTGAGFGGAIGARQLCHLCRGKGCRSNCDRRALPRLRG